MLLRYLFTGLVLIELFELESFTSSLFSMEVNRNSLWWFKAQYIHQPVCLQLEDWGVGWKSGCRINSHMQWKCQQACTLQGLIKTCLPFTPPQHCETERSIRSAHISFINTYLPLWFIGFSDTHLLVVRTHVSFLNTYVSLYCNCRASIINFIDCEISSAIKLSSNDLPVQQMFINLHKRVKTLPNSCLYV